MIKFLEAVAGTYYNNECDAMRDYVFVFPNRRSGAFFLHHLRRIAGKPLIAPDVMTMSELVQSWSVLAEATPFEQLLTLFSLHRRECDDTFDRFRFWGEMILNDFENVDSSLVNPKKLFENVAALKEISTNYLTEEQRNIIARYWPVEMHPRTISDRFWNHTPANDNVFNRKWNELLKLYEGLHRELRSRGMATKGMFLRDAVNRLSTDGTHILRHRRHIFVGFAYLTPAELKIIHLLSKMDVADFYWKNNSPALRMSGNKAGAWIRQYSSKFPSRYTLEEDEITTWPRIKVIGVPSKTGQTAILSELLVEEGSRRTDSELENAIDTAIVLPDESLLIPAIGAIPECYRTLNVTMGIPMRSTSVAALVSQLGLMHSKASKRNGQTLFYNEHVKTVLTNPLVNKLSPEGCEKILTAIVRDRLFLIPPEVFIRESPELAFLFSPESIFSFKSLKSYILELCTKLSERTDTNSPEAMVIASLIENVGQLESAVSYHDVEMLGTTAFRLLERSLSALTIPFEGKPLKGLQIMGALETRALDFDNLYILSMNEGIYPRKNVRRSFIPDSIRCAYGMNTSSHDDAVMAYNFYSMIARAENVTILYDARTGGTNAGELSRYVAQLLYLSGTPVDHRMATFSPALFTPDGISIEKDESIMESLAAYKREGDGSKYFSASALKDYIECPLRFYLKHIEGLNMEETNTEFIDASTYGTVVHSVAENLYKQNFGHRVITADALDNIISHPGQIDTLITEAMNETFYGRGKTADRLPPEGRLIGKVIRELIIEMLRNEKQFTPMVFVEGERNRTTRLMLPSGLTVNLKAFIDRVDKIRCNHDGSGGRLRCVDYKTGSEDLSFQSVETLFDATSGHYPKAIFQLMLYCNIYAGMENNTDAIQPFIYAFKTIAVSGLQPVKFGSRAKGSELVDYRPLNSEFLTCLDRMLREMFDINTPFRQAPTDKVCIFCSFKGICKRNPSRN